MDDLEEFNEWYRGEVARLAATGEPYLASDVAHRAWLESQKRKEPNDCADLIALLRRFGLKEVEATEHGSPGTHEFWVEEYIDDEKQVTVGAGEDGYGFFFCSFTFDAVGKYLSHGCAE